MKALLSKLKVVINVLAEASRHSSNKYLSDAYYIFLSMVNNIELIQRWTYNIDQQNEILKNIPDTYCWWVEDQLEILKIDKWLIKEYKSLIK